MNNVRSIQVLLTKKGFDPGPIDGDFGPRTENAIIEAVKTLDDAVWADIAEAPTWLKSGFKSVGLQEYPGAKHNSKIVEFWSKIRAPFTDDETPWCAAFVGAMLEQNNIVSTRSAAARSYNSYGFELSGPAVGCIVVFWRGKPDGWAGHVGFVVGMDAQGNLMVLGGNQGDAVSIKPFDTKRVLSYRWPNSVLHPERIGMQHLPRVESDGRVSTNEA